jgi:hypothetical protein
VSMWNIANRKPAMSQSKSVRANVPHAMAPGVAGEHADVQLGNRCHAVRNMYILAIVSCTMPLRAAKFLSPNRTQIPNPCTETYLAYLASCHLLVARGCPFARSCHASSSEGGLAMSAWRRLLGTVTMLSRLYLRNHVRVCTQTGRPGAMAEDLAIDGGDARMPSVYIPPINTTMNKVF